MKNAVTSTLALSALALAIAGAVPAAAQSGPGPGAGGPGMGGPGMMGGYGQRGWGGPGGGWHMWGGGGWWGGPDAMVSRVDGRLAFLKAELKITDAQKAAWDKFAAAVRASAKNMLDRMNAMHSGGQGGLTLPDRLELQEQFMTARLDEIKQVKAGLKDIYAVLTDAQKKDADTIVLPMMGFGMMGGGGWGMMGGGWGPGMMQR